MASTTLRNITSEGKKRKLGEFGWVELPDAVRRDYQRSSNAHLKLTGKSPSGRVAVESQSIGQDSRGDIITEAEHLGGISLDEPQGPEFPRIKDAEGRLILALEVFIYPLESTTFVDETFWRYLPRTANIQPLKLRDTADLNHELPTGLGNRKRSIRFDDNTVIYICNLERALMQAQKWISEIGNLPSCFQQIHKLALNPGVLKREYFSFLTRFLTHLPSLQELIFYTDDEAVDFIHQHVFTASEEKIMKDVMNVLDMVAYEELIDSCDSQSELDKLEAFEKCCSACKSHCELVDLHQWAVSETKLSRTYTLCSAADWSPVIFHEQ